MYKKVKKIWNLNSRAPDIVTPGRVARSVAAVVVFALAYNATRSGISFIIYLSICGKCICNNFTLSKKTKVLRGDLELPRGGPGDERHKVSDM